MNSFKWVNFRGYKDVEFEIKPITILLGKNNVGKSSLVAPILALKQTWDRRSLNEPFISDGSIVALGGFRDFIRGHDQRRSLSIEMSLPRMGVGQAVDKIAMTFKADGGSSIYLARHELLDSSGKVLFGRKRRASGDVFSLRSSVPSLEKMLAGSEGRILRYELGADRPEGFMFPMKTISSLKSRLIRELLSGRLDDPTISVEGIEALEVIHADAMTAIDAYFRGVSMVSPLRPLGDRVNTVVVKGNGAGAVDWFAELFFLSRGGRDYDYMVELNRMLRELGYGEIRLSDRGGRAFVCEMLHSRGVWVSAADVGVGFSQVLPVLLELSRSDSSGCLIVQQPEAHLNPAQHCALMDIIISRVQGARPVVLETHSEHVVLRLRRRISEGVISSKDVALYFCDQVDGRSVVMPISVSDDGSIGDGAWPRGFMEEDVVDSLAIAINSK